MPSTDDLFPDGLRDVRYGEVLLLSEDDGTYTAEVWNTLGLNDCPQEAWDALDAGAIAAERGALVALLNGPRRWTLDTIVPQRRTPGERRLTRFGDLDMFLAATVELGDTLPEPRPPTSSAGSPGTRSSASRRGPRSTSSPPATASATSCRPTRTPSTRPRTLASLADLGDRLELPEGWTFTTCVLDRTLDLLSTDGVATVVQDELQNTYQRIDAVSIAAMSGGA